MPIETPTLTQDERTDSQPGQVSTSAEKPPTGHPAHQEWVSKDDFKSSIGNCVDCGVSLYDVSESVREATRAAWNALSNFMGRRVKCPAARCDDCIIRVFPFASRDIAQASGKNNLGRINVLGEQDGIVTIETWCFGCGSHLGQRKADKWYYGNTIYLCQPCKFKQREKKGD